MWEGRRTAPYLETCRTKSDASLNSGNATMAWEAFGFSASLFWRFLWVAMRSLPGCAARIPDSGDQRVDATRWRLLEACLIQWWEASRGRVLFRVNSQLSIRTWNLHLRGSASCNCPSWMESSRHWRGTNGVAASPGFLAGLGSLFGAPCLADSCCPGNLGDQDAQQCTPRSRFLVHLELWTQQIHATRPTSTRRHHRRQDSLPANFWLILSISTPWWILLLMNTARFPG